jgi:hypothetical protein
MSRKIGAASPIEDGTDTYYVWKSDKFKGHSKIEMSLKFYGLTYEKNMPTPVEVFRRNNGAASI